MADYDVVLSLGNACACSQVLRRLGLQFASFPFDWTAGSTLLRRVELIDADFDGWLDRESMELTDVMTGRFNASIYRNRRTGITFSHDFPILGGIDAQFESVAAKYARRIERLYRTLDASEKVLACYAELPYRPAEPDDVLVGAWRILQRKFPKSDVHLLYFAQDASVRDPVERIVSPNVTRVSCNYVGNDEFGHEHEVDQGVMMDYLRPRVRVCDPRSEDEKRRYAESVTSRKQGRWGFGFGAFVNHRAYRLYRRIERFLIGRGVIAPTQRPLKLY